MSSNNYTSQNDLLLNNLMEFYKNNDNLDKMLKIITGESKISLRIVDWFATNYAKKYYTLYSFEDIHGITRRFKVYVDYKLKLKAYSKRRFDPFCRWERISIPYKNGTFIETTIGQLNFFKWTLENKVINYIEDNYETIEKDMNTTLKSRESERKFMKVEKIKRKELSVPGNKSFHITRVSAVIKFI
jgi:hypothetical protein